MRPRHTTLLVPGIAPHNVPECMAVGMAFAGWLTGGVTITFAGALAQAIGMAMRNTLEGMVISPPLCDERGGASASSKRLDACGRKSRHIEGERRLSHSWVSGIVWAAVA